MIKKSVDVRWARSKVQLPRYQRTPALGWRAMEIELRHQPSYATARVSLTPNEGIRLESDAMMAMSPSINLEAKMEGGLMKSLKRAAFGGESFFQTTCTAGPEGGWVDVAPGLPGDILTVDADPTHAWVLTKSSWLASATTVELDTKWGGFKNLIGSEGGFVVHATGTGPVLANCYGALDVYELPAGYNMVLDTGHLVAMADTVQMTLRKAAPGWMNSIKSGEGFVFDLVGPGRIYAQSRNPGWFGRFASASHSHGG